MHRLVVLSLLIIFLIIPLVGNAHSQASRLNIVTTTSIIADVVSNVAGDAADITPLMGPGVDPHSFQASAQDIVLVDEADLIFINGANFEEGLLSILTESSKEQLISVSACVPVLAGGHAHEDDDEHDEAEVEAPVVQDVTCTPYYDELEPLIGDIEGEPLITADCDEGCDPHVWLDVRNVMLWTVLVRDVLSAGDPANAEMYAANADAYLQALIELDSELDEAVSTMPVEERLLVTNHDSLGYLAAHYGFEVIGTVLEGRSTGASPSAQHVVGVIETIEDSGVRAIFVDNTSNHDVADQIADETGVPVVALYSGSLSEADGPAPTYLDYMRYNMAQIVSHLAAQD